MNRRFNWLSIEMMMGIISLLLTASLENSMNIDVKYTDPKMVVMEYLGVIIKMDLMYRNEVTLLHHSLLEDQVNCIGFHDNYYHLSKLTEKAYVVFVGEGVGKMSISHEEVNNKTLVDRENFKVIVLTPEKKLTHMLKLSVTKDGRGWLEDEYFFVKLPHITLSESRYYLVKDEKSDLTIRLTQTPDAANTPWSYMMYDTKDTYTGMNGSMPWTNQLHLPVLQFYLHVFTADTSIRTRIMIFDRFDVYKPQQDHAIVYNVDNETKCARVTFETCKIFQIDVSCTYVDRACVYVFDITHVSHEIYPCQLKMWIGLHMFSVDSAIPISLLTYDRKLRISSCQIDLIFRSSSLYYATLLVYIMMLIVNYEYSL